MRLLSSLIMTNAVLLSACAVGPKFEQPQAQLPERWEVQTPQGIELASNVDERAIEEQWWKQFGDPMLGELIEQAKQTNPDARIAALRVAQSRVQRDVIAGNRTPAVAANASYQRQRQSEFGTGTRLIDAISPPDQREGIIDVLSEPYDVYRAGFDASWELDLWGRLGRAVEAADASLAASAENLHGAQLSIIAEVARTYLELRGVQDQLAIAMNDVAASEDALELTTLRAERGAVTQLDVVSQRARLADVRAGIPRLEHLRERLINDLALLLGEQPGVLDQRLAEAREVPSAPAIVGVGIPSELARRRPDIRQAEARLQAATAEIGVAVADLYPRFTLTGGFLQESLEAGDLSEWGARQWHVGPSLYLPLFDGGRRRSTVELRKLQHQEAAVEYQRAVLRAWHEIDNALGAYISQQQRTSELAAAVTASRDAYELASMRYEHGMTSFLVALDAQRTMLRAQQAFSESTTAVSTQLVAVYKALGGGWQ
jgi:NodT family efflux transporter outer membrane factor (OMF) lipoprotein